jgi:hypothetical protein
MMSNKNAGRATNTMAGLIENHTPIKSVSTKDRKTDTTQREHLMNKNVIPTHQSVHWRHPNYTLQRRSHITKFFRRLTPFWNIEMPHKRDQTKLLTTPQQEVKRCGTPKQKQEKPQKS